MRWSLKLKALAVMTALIIVVASVLTLDHTSRQREILTQGLEAIATVLARNLAFNGEYGVLVGDRTALQDLVDGLLQEQDVVYAAVLDRDLSVLAQAERAAAAGQPAELFRPTLTAQKLPATYIGQAKERVCVVQHPLLLKRRERWINELVLFAGDAQEAPELIGMTVVGLSTKPLIDHLASLRQTTLTLTGLIVGVSWCLGYLLVSFLTGPLRRLKIATEQVAGGNLAIQLSSRSQDEVGDLTRSFNAMVREIRQSRDRIEGYTRRLETTAKNLSELNREMEELLHVVSHDLRAPLINIQGFSQRLEPLMQETVRTLETAAAQSASAASREQVEAFKSHVQARFAESMKFISKGVQKMDTLLSLLLAISRVGRKADPLQPNDLNQLVDDVLATFDHQLQERAIRVIRHPMPAAVTCRRNEINQVLSNLLANAINYMGVSEQRLIEIGATARAEEVECFVRDTGIGIAPADQERVFGMFTRLHAVDVPGEGIGLAYVKKIIRLHGGRIWVTSATGQGSAFHFTLPTGPLGGGS